MTLEPDQGQAETRLGEVVEATTAEYTVHCYRLYDAPALGSLVRASGERPIYGVVCEVGTQSLDPGRRPIAMGEEAESEEQVYQRNPQLDRLLSTQFRSIVVGHRSNGRLNRYLAPLPPRIHSFVYSCDQEEVREFSASLDFLSVLLASPAGSPDDVVASFLRQASIAYPEPERFLLVAGKDLAALLGNQLQRLNSILKRIAP